MSTFTESPHPRGGNVANPGQFSHKTTDVPAMTLVDPTPERQRLEAAMMELDTGLNDLCVDYEFITLEYEDPDSFGAGHFVLRPEGDQYSRFAIEEVCEGADPEDEDRLPTAWKWRAEELVPHTDGTLIWARLIEGETTTHDVKSLLDEVHSWARPMISE